MKEIKKEDNIGHIHIGGEGHPDKRYLIVWGKKPSTRISMEQLKDEILQNQKLRQLVEERIELMNKTIVTPKHCKEILESLLDKAKKPITLETNCEGKS